MSCHIQCGDLLVLGGDCLCARGVVGAFIMEYTSPGGIAVAKFLAAVTSLVILGVAVLVPPTKGQHHDVRHGRHYNRHRIHDLDYEDSTVVMPPQFLNVKHNVTVIEGDMATLPCAVRNLGTKQIAWRKVGDNHILTVGSFTWVRENNIQVDNKFEDGQVSRWNLLIKAVKKEDEGTYQCQITDKTPLRIHIYLTVKPRPPVNKSVVAPRLTEPQLPSSVFNLTGTEFVDRNDPILLECKATGATLAPEKVDWFKDGLKLDTNNRDHPRIQLEEYTSLQEERTLISKLRIEHADINDSGLYICRISVSEVASIKVTVLVADTTNVKRGTGAHEEEAGLNGHSAATQHTSVVLTLSFFCLLHILL
ncbi:zwei Ig domain protein zig-8-like isoform X3 [Biomphalaria glabrata]|uniref:Zwei Ig domain protein zig-8-like isoform X3 n=1 Tax=Biomphalaria glabrata TaxID=6526 RepID=A0A9W2ZDJ5_BIOGL|nr:zwei Ig domain protein zig-8-like isoform X3 [Biomphalaria glabrata]